MVNKSNEFPEMALVVGRDRAGTAQQIPLSQDSLPRRRLGGRTPKPGDALNALVHNIEALLARSHSLGTATTVEKNIRLRDKDSGSAREFDVLITVQDHLRKTLTAIECKDKGRPVNVDVVEAYHTKCQSCGIHHAVVVSSQGFSKSALRKAKQKNIDCFTLKEAVAPDWLRELGISLVFTKPKLGEYEVRWDLPQEVLAGWASGRWKYITPMGNPFEEALERSLMIDQQSEWQNLHDIRVRHFMNPDKIQILDTLTNKRYSAELLSIEVMLEKLEHPVIFTHRRYENQDNKTAAIDGSVATFNAMGFKGTATFIGAPGSTVTGHITIEGNDYSTQ